LVAGCKRNTYNNDSWQEISGSNKGELEKVISYFKTKNEPLKVKAALFLIENLKDQYHLTGERITKDRFLFNILDSIHRSGEEILNRTWDSMQYNQNLSNISGPRQVYDLQTVKAAQLIQHIDACFRAWHFPWAQNLSFEEFCDFILPVKYANEDIEAWMPNVQKDFSFLLDSGKYNYSYKDICILANKELKNNFSVNGRISNAWSFNYSDFKKLRAGTCAQTTQMTSYVMAGLGVPVAMDYTPCWANKNSAHKWSALIYKGKPLHFMGSESDPGKDKIYFTRYNWLRRKMAKVFRRTFAIQPNSLAFSSDASPDIPDLFKNSHAKDVTREYMPVSDVPVFFKNNTTSQKIAYLCVFNDNEWKPVAWAKINLFGKATFSDMGRDILYMPAFYYDGQVIPAGSLFILNREGDIIKIQRAKDKSEKLIIRRKYPEDKSNKIFKGEDYELLYWDEQWLSAGKQRAAADSLIYSNVPAGTLYWIRNLNKGVQERLFTYENGKQVWW
jgi:hypothetical protein